MMETKWVMDVATILATSIKILQLFKSTTIWRIIQVRFGEALARQRPGRTTPSSY